LPPGALRETPARLHANKAELLMVLERPEIPLHTNGSENDIRCQVTRRKVSAGTRSDLDRDCRDAFLGLAKTCARHGVAFWDYLGSRLKVPGHTAVPPGTHPLPRAASLRPTTARGFADITSSGNTGKTPGEDALFSCVGSGKSDSSYV
jgi:hypothetical protein